MIGHLVLEDGTVFAGQSFGMEGVSGGEVVFNTAMTGYQEILTDPSYEGQIIAMTYPEIGNYGVNSEDMESRKVFCSGFVVRQYNEVYSNWRGTGSLGLFLEKEKVVALSEIDTRALTKKIRSFGSMRAVIGSEKFSIDELKKRIQQVPFMTGQNLAIKVAKPEVWSWEETSGPHVVAIDCGIKLNILRELKNVGANVTVVPPTVSAQEILKLKPTGIVISNGPGDPDAVKGLPDVLSQLAGKVPMLGICLGHQLLALALGAKTYKLKFGHHGANHPVRNEKTGRIEITSQNHGFAVDPESLSKVERRFGKTKVTHFHLSDQTLEGFELSDVKIQAIQYHPEASPGPHDSNYLFKEFMKCIKTS